MIETTVPVKIPPGLFTNGTMLDREGRWADGNLVRFNNGYPQAMGAASTLTLSGTPPAGTPQAAFAWYDGISVQGSRAVVGKSNKLYTILLSTSPYPMTNITPAVTLTSLPTATWTFDTLDNVLLAARTRNAVSAFSDFLWVWDPGVGGLAVAASGAPLTSGGVFVTPEQFVVIIPAPRDIQWASQGTYTQWTPSVSNSAGGLSIPSVGALLGGKRVRSQSLLFTADDVWTLDYIGAPLYYGATRVGSGAGPLTINVVSVVRDVAYWMGAGGFYKYDGYVQKLNCDVADTVFTQSLYRSNSNAFFSIVNTQLNEIQWYYCSTSSAATPDKMVAYNYDNDTWSLGTISRAAGTDAIWHPLAANEGVRPLFFDADGTTVYAHETTGVIAGAYVESGPSFINDGDQTALVQKIIPDGAVTGDSITLFSGTDPGVAEVTNGPSSVTTGTRIDTRFRARYLRYKQTLTTAASRVGVPKLGIIPSSKR